MQASKVLHVLVNMLQENNQHQLSLVALMLVSTHGDVCQFDILVCRWRVNCAFDNKHDKHKMIDLFTRSSSHLVWMINTWVFLIRNLIARKLKLKD